MKVGDSVIVMYDGNEVSGLVARMHSEKVLDVAITAKDGHVFQRTSVVLQEEVGALHEGQWKPKS